MQLKRFRKRPIAIKAILLTTENVVEVAEWCGARIRQPGNPGFNPAIIEIPTLEGPHTAISGDWIIQGIKGEFYPCKAGIFELTYEPTGAD